MSTSVHVTLLYRHMHRAWVAWLAQWMMGNLEIILCAWREQKVTFCVFSRDFTTWMVCLTVCIMRGDRKVCALLLEKWESLWMTIIIYLFHIFTPALLVITTNLSISLNILSQLLGVILEFKVLHDSIILHLTNLYHPPECVIRGVCLKTPVLNLKQTAESMVCQKYWTHPLIEIGIRAR